MTEGPFRLYTCTKLHIVILLDYLSLLSSVFARFTHKALNKRVKFPFGLLCFRPRLARFLYPWYGHLSSNLSRPHIKVVQCCNFRCIDKSRTSSCETSETERSTIPQCPESQHEERLLCLHINFRLLLLKHFKNSIQQSSTKCTERARKKGSPRDADITRAVYGHFSGDVRGQECLLLNCWFRGQSKRSDR
jgi:hypothetical protein